MRQVPSLLIAQALSISPPGQNVFFPNFTTDSRKITPGCFFVAIPGDHFDGNDFVEDAIQKGAGAVLYNRPLPTDKFNQLSNRAWLIHVPDTTEALRKIAQAWRRDFKIPVLAIGGSAGKTTTKELIAAMLRGKFRSVLKTQGSQNGFLGIPMTLMELSPLHETAVIEIGIDDVGAMIQHVKLVQPDLAILTSIGPEHLEKLKDLPTVAQEECILLSETLRAGGQACISLDDPWIQKMHFEPHQKITGFTLNSEKNPDHRTVRGSWNPDSNTLEVSYRNQTFVLSCPLEGRHNASNLLAACTLALNLGLTSDEIQAGLQTFHGAPGRSELKSFSNGTTVLCDYYNANPSSMVAAMELLSAKPGGKLIACLGDMLELGALEESLHRGLADTLIQRGFAQVLLFGERMRWLENALKRKKFSGHVRCFESKKDLTHELLGLLSDGDRILIKGSRGMKMEDIWEDIRPTLEKQS